MDAARCWPRSRSRSPSCPRHARAGAPGRPGSRASAATGSRRRTSAPGDAARRGRAAGWRRGRRGQRERRSDPARDVGAPAHARRRPRRLVRRGGLVRLPGNIEDGAIATVALERRRRHAGGGRYRGRQHRDQSRRAAVPDQPRGRGHGAAVAPPTTVVNSFLTGVAVQPDGQDRPSEAGPRSLKRRSRTTSSWRPGCSRPARSTRASATGWRRLRRFGVAFPVAPPRWQSTPRAG